MKFKYDANGTCSLLILSDFGEEAPTYDDDTHNRKSPCAKDFKQFVGRLRQKVNSFNEGKLPDNITTSKCTFDGFATIQATTASIQPLAEEWLERFGFERFGPTAKRKHQYTKLSIWLMPVSTFLETLTAWEKELDIQPGETEPEIFTEWRTVIVDVATFQAAG